jgi:hypothetical protein
LLVYPKKPLPIAFDLFIRIDFKIIVAYLIIVGVNVALATHELDEGQLID